MTDAQARAERLQTEANTLNTAIAEAQEREQQAQAARDERAGQREEKTTLRRAMWKRGSSRFNRNKRQPARHWKTRAAAQAEQSARLSTLTELQENHEGFYQGVRAVLNGA